LAAPHAAAIGIAVATDIAEVRGALQQGNGYGVHAHPINNPFTAIKRYCRVPAKGHPLP
jgi:hypothetical protein